MIHQPLDVQYWFVNIFSGSMNIFILISILVILWLSAKFRMQTSSFTIIIIAYSAILAAAGQSALLILMILVLAPLLFWLTRRVVE